MNRWNDNMGEKRRFAPYAMDMNARIRWRYLTLCHGRRRLRRGIHTCDTAVDTMRYAITPVHTTQGVYPSPDRCRSQKVKKPTFLLQVTTGSWCGPEQQNRDTDTLTIGDNPPPVKDNQGETRRGERVRDRPTCHGDLLMSESIA